MMRPRNRISDQEQSPEETATISKRGSSQRAAANRARQWIASESDNDHRQLQSPERPSISSSSRARASRMVIPPNTNSNSSTASTTRSPRKTTNSTAGEGSSRSAGTRRLRNISQSEPSVTPPPHTVDHNYGEPSSRRSSRNRHQLSRHQRNADELDQTPEEDEDPHTEDPTDDTSDDAPLRPRAATRTNQISTRLRSKTASPTKRGKKSSATSEEDDGARQDDSDEEFVGGEEESDSEEKITADSTDDDSEDNTPLRMMSKSRSSRTRPPPGRSTAATSGNVSSRTRQKERFSSEDDYGGPGPSTLRNTRNLKRPRYNEDSDEEDTGRGHQRPKRPTVATSERPHQYFGGGGPSSTASRLQRNGDATTSNTTGTDSHSSEDNEAALTSVSSRGRVRRIKPNVRRIFRE